MAEAASDCASIVPCWILDTWMLSKRTEFYVVRSWFWTFRTRWNSRVWIQKWISSSACQEHIHRSRDDHFLLDADSAAWTLRPYNSDHFVILWFHIYITTLLLLMLRISVTSEQDICATIRCQKFGCTAIKSKIAIFCTPIFFFCLLTLKPTLVPFQLLRLSNTIGQA
jgi:hypothetical protein